MGWNGRSNINISQRMPTTVNTNGPGRRGCPRSIANTNYSVGAIPIACCPSTYAQNTRASVSIIDCIFEFRPSVSAGSTICGRIEKVDGWPSACRLFLRKIHTWMSAGCFLQKILVTRHPHMQQIMQFCEACISSVSTENSIYNQEIHGNIKKYCSLAISASFFISNYLLQYSCILGQSRSRAELF